MTIEVFIILICQALLLLFFVYSIWSMIFAAPYYPSRIKHLDEAIKELDFELPNEATFVDLGSGDGRFVRWASTQGYSATGVEANPFYSLWSRFRSLFSPHKQQQVYLNKNFNDIELSEYSMVYTYLYPSVMAKLEPRLWDELKPGSILISHTFTYPSKQPLAQSGKIKIYKVE